MYNFQKSFFEKHLQFETLYYTVIRQIVSRIDRLQDTQTVGQTDRQTVRKTEEQWDNLFVLISTVNNFAYNLRI